MAELESVGAPLAASVQAPASSVPAATIPSRHFLLVRVTHWITTFCFLALLVTGTEIVISHPRFYWGETGNVLTTPSSNSTSPPRALSSPPATATSSRTRTAGAATSTFNLPGLSY